MSLSQLLPVFDPYCWSESNSLLELSKLKERFTVVTEVANPQIQPCRLLKPIFFLSKLGIDHLHSMCSSKMSCLLSDGKTNLRAMHYFEIFLFWVRSEIDVLNHVEDSKDFILSLLKV